MQHNPYNDGLNIVTSSKTMEKLLITGANGFVGAALCQELAARGKRFVACVRENGDRSALERATFETGDLSGDVDWMPALA